MPYYKVKDILPIKIIIIYTEITIENYPKLCGNMFT